ncbi:MAG: hypothetical protein N3C60_00250 [Calditerrivibrio sp.]|nr:hypothetical protein [Calditerrivibrio sp.]
MKMGNESIMMDEFKNRVENLKVNYRGSSFNPFKFHRNVNGKQIPVYFIGAPGLYVAIVATIVSIVMMIMFRFNAGLGYWAFMLIFSAFLLRISLKIDKARQIRFFCNDILLKSYSLIKKYEETLDLNCLREANKLLDEFSKYIYDDVVENQKLVLLKILN